MKNLFFIFNFSFLVLFSFTSTAEDNIYKSISTCGATKLSKIKYSQCLDIVKNKVDKELDTWINNQTFVLEENIQTTGRKSAYRMFKRAQQNFITYRENNCKWQYLIKLPSSESITDYKICYITMSKDRIKELTRVSK